jgi:hypothetical protein
MGRACLKGEMKPITARVFVTLIVLAFVIGASAFVELAIPRQLCSGDRRARSTVSRTVVFFAVFAASGVPDLDSGTRVEVEEVRGQTGNN